MVVVLLSGWLFGRRIFRTTIRLGKNERIRIAGYVWAGVVLLFHRLINSRRDMMAFWGRLRYNPRIHINIIRYRILREGRVEYLTKL